MENLVGYGVERQSVMKGPIRTNEGDHSLRGGRHLALRQPDSSNDGAPSYVCFSLGRYQMTGGQSEEGAEAVRWILPAPTSEQQVLLDAVTGIYLEYEKWPTWQWLEETLERDGLDAASIVASLPRTHSYGYGFLRGLRDMPQRLDTIKLTIAGLSHVPVARVRVLTFIRFVGALGTLRSEVVLDPFEDIQRTITKSDVLRVIYPSTAADPELLELLNGEPPVWNCQVSQMTESDWSLIVSPITRRFAGVSSIEDYFERFVQFVSSIDDQPFENPVSPFTLPASFDYLDAVWHLRFGAPLVVPPGVERSARLAFTATTNEEADSRLSALAELLKNLAVPSTPGIGGHALERLRAYLLTQIPAEAVARVTDAIEILNAARSMRVGSQHHAASPGFIAACTQLNIAYPIADWSEAWSRIQSMTAAAVNAIRDEIQASE